MEEIVKNYSVKEFKEAIGIASLKVIQNPKTGLLFTNVDGLTVSHSIDLQGDLQVIEFANGHKVLCNNLNTLLDL